MAITNFIPEIWDARLFAHLRNRLVFAQDGLVNRDYEGDIANAGDTVRITQITDVTVSDYSASAGLTYGDLSDDQMTFVIDQAKAFAFRVDDIEKRQALPGYVEEATRSAAYALSNKVDTYVSGLMAANLAKGTGTDPFGNDQTVDNQLEATTEARTISADGDAYDMLVELRTKLVKANCPEQGRWVVVPPEVYANLLHDDRFIRADASGTTEGLRNGHVGRAAGFDIYESNTVPTGTDVTNGAYWKVLAGHSMATTFAQQILKTEALRLEKSFSDGVRGLHVYAAKVIRPELLAVSYVDQAGS